MLVCPPLREGDSSKGQQTDCEKRDCLYNAVFRRLTVVVCQVFTQHKNFIFRYFTGPSDRHHRGRGTGSPSFFLCFFFAFPLRPCLVPLFPDDLTSKILENKNFRAENILPTYINTPAAHNPSIFKVFT